MINPDKSILNGESLEDLLIALTDVKLKDGRAVKLEPTKIFTYWGLKEVCGWSDEELSRFPPPADSLIRRANAYIGHLLIRKDPPSNEFKCSANCLKCHIESYLSELEKFYDRKSI